VATKGDEELILTGGKKLKLWEERETKVMVSN
jgi:hypothetical protein